ncbi:aminopeptidase [Paenibacillus sp. FSL K6-0108]
MLGDFHEKLQRYAALVVNVGVHVQKGQTLVITAPISAIKRRSPPKAAVGMVSGMLKFDLSEYPVEGQLPDIPDLVEASNGMKSRYS